MKFVVILLLTAFSFCSVRSQSINLLGFSLGTASLSGDIGNRYYRMSFDAPSVGVTYERYRHKLFSYRAGISVLSFQERDANLDSGAMKVRDYSTSNTLVEFFLGGEFSFRSFKPYERKFQFAPYITSGIAPIAFHSKYFEENTKVAQTSGWQYNIALPIILGIKFKVERLIIAPEIGFRYTFTDNLEGSRPLSEKYVSFGQSNNDWYFFTGVSVLFLLNRVKCFVCFD